MKSGDRAFFYHSSCKVPGIYGVVDIVEAAIPDPAARDPNVSLPFFVCMCVHLRLTSRLLAASVLRSQSVRRGSPLVLCACAAGGAICRARDAAGAAAGTGELGWVLLGAESVLRKREQHATALADMVLLRQSRLSVQPVRSGEWDYILRTVRPASGSSTTA
jgi:hypothetical protein